MLFYDEFIKKINENTSTTYKDIEKYSLELKRKIMWLGTGIPILLIGIYQVYAGIQNNNNVINIIFGLIFFYIAFKHIKTVVNYKIQIDNKNKILIYENIILNFSEIKSCVLREGTIGKKGGYQIILDIITTEDKQYLLPLMMGKKINFVKNIKYNLEEKFKIIK